MAELELTDVNKRLQLIVFSDDWGRHPSSCQHLIRPLLAHHSVIWVETIGMRAPSLSRDDLRRAAAKVRGWCRGARPPASALPNNPTIVRPLMWPGFRQPWQRALNAAQVARAVHRAAGPRREDETRVVLTTVPVTADLIRGGPEERHTLDADAWVYYCVDDFSVWPGLDAEVLESMERQQLEKVELVITVSDELKRRIGELGRDSRLLTHGIDLGHWEDPADGHASEDSRVKTTPSACAFMSGEFDRPLGLFWGLIDSRLDMSWLEALVESRVLASLVFVGPQQNLDPRLFELPTVTLTGSVPYGSLPACAGNADVLLMPYANLPVTRAAQPLKFLEYLATGKPVVARALPSNRDWADAADLVEDATAFVEAVRLCLKRGIGAEQLAARRRLREQTWDKKSRQLGSWLAEAESRR